MVSGHKTWDGNQLADAVANNYPEGLDRLKSIMNLSVNLLSRDKINYTPQVEALTAKLKNAEDRVRQLEIGMHTITNLCDNQNPSHEEIWRLTYGFKELEELEGVENQEELWREVNKVFIKDTVFFIDKLEQLKSKFRIVRK